MSELEKILDEYFDKFGVNYPLNIVAMMTDEEIIERIRMCIDSNRQEDTMEYDDDADY